MPPVSFISKSENDNICRLIIRTVFRFNIQLQSSIVVKLMQIKVFISIVILFYSWFHSCMDLFLFSDHGQRIFGVFPKLQQL